MSRHPAEERLALYLSRDLDASLQQTVAGHLADCPTCRETLSQLERVRRLLVDSVGEPLDDDVQKVRQSVLHQITETRRKGAGARWIWSVAAAMACVAAICAIMPRPSPVHPLEARALTLKAPVAAPRELTDVSLPVQRHRPLREHSFAGIRSVSWNVSRNGSSQLRITTGDPTVLILLPSEKVNDEHEN